MDYREKIIEVKDLVVSFRTGEGKVQAVRDISFDLYKGETLAIVGESGSGKSVTCKAILGISAVNAIYENGEIIFIDRDLLQISEDDFHKIRGDKIAMVFQDPLSALNPIMKTGKQMTEAIIQNNKVKRTDAAEGLKKLRSNFKRHLGLAVQESSDPSKFSDYQSKADLFESVINEQIKLETEFRGAVNGAREISRLAKQMRIDLSNFDNAAVQKSMNEMTRAITKADHPFLLNSEDKAELNSMMSSYNANHKHEEFSEALQPIIEKMEQRIENKDHDFSALAYCLVKDHNARLGSLDQVEARKRFDSDFLEPFNKYVVLAIEHADKLADKNRDIALKVISENEAVFAQRPIDINACKKALEKINLAVDDCINDLEVIKDSTLYTFRHSGLNALQTYKDSIKRNKKEQKRYERDLRKHARAERKGEVDWKVVPLNLNDLDKLQDTLQIRVQRLKDRITTLENGEAGQSKEERALQLLRKEIELASDSSYKVTNEEAKDKAIRLMREVGLPRPELHFNQYPFELSGGMRQRVVIAIALCSDPDVLICDEPTTALDVTIQAQILDLINKLKEERNLSIIFITHDLGVVAHMADRVAVMYAGKIVETGTVEEIYYEPAHPYTWALLASMPDLETKEELDPIPGTPPNMLMPPKGDAFADRNKYAMAIDFEEEPPMFKISDTHYAATWLLHPDAPKVVPPAIVTERIERMKAKQEVVNND